MAMSANQPSGLIIALESCSGLASVAVARGDKILAEAELEAAHGHAGWIIPLAQDALTQADAGFDQVSTILAGRGPGSFTGIRVALAAAKGLGLSLNLTPIGLSSLAALSLSGSDDSDDVMAMISIIDSRRKSVYAQAFTPDGLPLSDVFDGDDDMMLNLAKTITGKGHVRLFGHDSGHYADLLKAEGIAAKAGVVAFPAARHLCHYHHHHPQINQGLEPLYLAPPLISTAKS